MPSKRQDEPETQAAVSSPAPPSEAAEPTPPGGVARRESAAAAPKPDLCPDCAAPLTLYEGENPHKAGQGFCERCHARKPLGHH